MSEAPPAAPARRDARSVPPWLRTAVDYIGPGAFLLGYLVHRQILPATWWLVAGSALGLVIAYGLERRVAVLPAVWGGAALVFGLLTLVFHDPRIIKVKVTAMNFALGMAMLGGVLLRRNPLKAIMGETLTLSDATWRKLTLRYGAFFFVMAALNELVWRTQPEATWVLFRMPGLLILTLVFAATQLPLMLREVNASEAAAALAEVEE